MTIEITLRGSDPATAVDEAAALLREIGQCEPDRRTSEPDPDQRRDPATAIAVASLILSLPGAVLATLQIKEHLDRLRDRVEALKTRFEATDTEAFLQAPTAGAVDLRRTATDAVVDLLLRDLGARGHAQARGH